MYGLAGNLTCRIVELSAKRWLLTTTIHPIVSGTPRFQAGENPLKKISAAQAVHPQGLSCYQNQSMVRCLFEHSTLNAWGFF